MVVRCFLTKKLSTRLKECKKPQTIDTDTHTHAYCRRLLAGNVNVCVFLTSNNSRELSTHMYEFTHTRWYHLPLAKAKKKGSVRSTFASVCEIFKKNQMQFRINSDKIWDCHMVNFIISKYSKLTAHNALKRNNEYLMVPVAQPIFQQCMFLKFVEFII